MDDALFVHHFEGRWIVAAFYDGTFYAPFGPAAQRANGEVGRTASAAGSLDYVAGLAYTYTRRADAIRRARQLFAGGEVL